MADTTTTNYSLTKPEVGASEDTWGTKLNTDLDSIDTQMKTNADAAAAAQAAADAVAATDITLTLDGDVTGSATFTNLGDATLTATVADDSHNHVISNVDGLQAELDAIEDLSDSTSNISTTGYVEAGRGSGPAALVCNDGYGNANVTFNHRSATPEQNGNSGRIHCNVDATSNASIILGVLSNVTSGVTADVTDVLTVSESGITSSGDVTALGDVTAYSDERLKKNWRSVDDNFIQKLSEVKSGIYERIDIEGKVQAGVSAQSLQKVLPEAVVEASDNFAVNYGNAALVAAVELSKRVLELEKRIKTLEPE